MKEKDNKSESKEEFGRKWYVIFEYIIPTFTEKNTGRNRHIDICHCPVKQFFILEASLIKVHIPQTCI
jgi:hypothetical protein